MSTDERASWAALVARRREQLEMTQDQLAVAADVAPKTVYNIETGGKTPQTRTLRRVQDALGLSSDIRVARVTVEEFEQSRRDRRWRVSISSDSPDAQEVPYAHLPGTPRLLLIDESGKAVPFDDQVRFAEAVKQVLASRPDEAGALLSAMAEALRSLADASSGSKPSENNVTRLQRGPKPSDPDINLGAVAQKQPLEGSGEEQ
jgi:DNA-binding XRE family transcriptional regulator